jgi:tetratricopeptide (TPR) repeat protein
MEAHQPVHQEDEDMPRRLNTHPAEVELLALAVGRDADAPEETRGHVALCPTCARREAELENLAGAVELESILQREVETAPTRPASPRAVERRERLARLAVDADAAQREAETLLELARDAQADLAGRVRDLAASTGGRLALLYAAQLGAFAAAVPTRALAFADAIVAAANGPERPAEQGMLAVPGALLRAEGRLLASQALLNIGRLPEAREAALGARREFAVLGRDPFSLALCDYFEASVLCFQGEFAPAERRFKAAARVFADFAQDHWVGRAETMLAHMLVQRGNAARALASFDAAVERLDPERDANAYAVGVLNRARCLALLGRFEAARQGYAHALQVARRHRLEAIVLGVRQNLAELELLRGELEKALASYRAVAAEADRLGLEEDQVVTRLGAAECLGRLGRTDEMMDALREIGRLVAVTDLAGNPAWSELSARLDPGDVDVGLVSQVREHLAAARDGFVLPFRAAKRA